MLSIYAVFKKIRKSLSNEKYWDWYVQVKKLVMLICHINKKLWQTHADFVRCILLASPGTKTFLQNSYWLVLPCYLFWAPAAIHNHWWSVILDMAKNSIWLHKLGREFYKIITALSVLNNFPQGLVYVKDFERETFATRISICLGMWMHHLVPTTWSHHIYYFLGDHG